MAARRWYAHITGLTVDAFAAINPFQWLTSDANGTITQTDVTPSRVVVTDSNGLPMANASLTSGRIVRADGTGSLTSNDALTASRVMVSDASGFPASATLTSANLENVAHTVSDTSSIDLTLSSGTLSADVKSGGVSLSMLAGGTGAWVYISSSTANNQATLSFTGLSTYDAYKVVMYDVASGNDAVSFLMRASTDNGSTYPSTASYGWSSAAIAPTGVVAGGSTGDTSVQLAGNLGNAATTEAISGEFTMIHRGSGSTVSRFLFDGSARTAAPTYVRFTGCGSYNVGDDVNAVVFFMSAGNILRGTFRLYGLRES
jgi:hypothetical protein